MTHLVIPATDAMARLPVSSDRLELAGGTAASPERADLRALGDLMQALGQDAAWAVMDPDDDEIASWIALRVADLDGRSPGRFRHDLRDAEGWDRVEEMRETLIGSALRTVERVALPMPSTASEGAMIVSVNITWSWVLHGQTMLVLSSNTTSLDHAPWVERHVDLVAEGVHHPD